MESEKVEAWRVEKEGDLPERVTATKTRQMCRLVSVHRDVGLIQLQLAEEEPVLPDFDSSDIILEFLQPEGK